MFADYLTPKSDNAATRIDLSTDYADFLAEIIFDSNLRNLWISRCMMEPSKRSNLIEEPIINVYIPWKRFVHL